MNCGLGMNSSRDVILRSWFVKNISPFVQALHNLMQTLVKGENLFTGTIIKTLFNKYILLPLYTVKHHTGE